MKNIQRVADGIMTMLRRNAVGKENPRVRQVSLDRAFREGKEVIVFQNTNGDWFEIAISEHWSNGA